jgi:hypothetical protein
MDPNPNNVIPGVIAGAVGALKAAYAVPSVKRFVFTSSSSAAVVSIHNAPGATITEDSWSEGAVKKAWSDPPYERERAGAVYAASKNQSEKAIWDYHKERRSERPDLVVNTGKMVVYRHKLLFLTGSSTTQLQLGQVYRSCQPGIPQQYRLRCPAVPGQRDACASRYRSPYVSSPFQ